MYNNHQDYKRSFNLHYQNISQSLKDRVSFHWTTTSKSKGKNKKQQYGVFMEFFVPIGIIFI